MLRQPPPESANLNAGWLVEQRDALGPGPFRGLEADEVDPRSLARIRRGPAPREPMTSGCFHSVHQPRDFASGDVEDAERHRGSMGKGVVDLGRTDRGIGMYVE